MKRPPSAAPTEVEAPEARVVTFTLQIDATVESGTFEAPGFRFRFLDGSKKQTPVIGVGTAWTPLHGDDNNSSSSGDGITGYRFEQSFPDVAISEDFALALDQDPILSVFLFDHPGLAGAGSTPRAAGKDAKPPTGKATAAAAATVPTVDPSTPQHRPQAFAGLFDLDLSSLLSGELHVEQTWVSASVVDQSTSPSSASGHDVFLSKRSKLQLPGWSLWHLPSASGLTNLTIRVAVDRPLLAGELLKKLNPLTLTVGSVRRLPGVAARRAGAASPHEPLRQYCKAAFALVNFFPGQLESRLSSIASPRATQLHAIPRVILTPAQLQDDTIRWETKVTLLCGRFETAELLDVLQFSSLTIEIHDRDLKQVETLTRLQTKWESLFATGIDPSQNQSDDAQTASPGTASEGSVSITGQSRATTPHTIASTAVAATPSDPPKPLDLQIVDDIARSDWRTMLANSGRLFPYGLARFRLSELLNTAKQRMNGMRPGDDRPYMKLKLTTDVIAMKRRASPLGTPLSSSEEAELPSTVDLTPLEKAIREPGAYVSAGTSVSIHVQLQAPVAVVNMSAADIAAAPATTRVEGESPLLQPLANSTRPNRLKFSRMVVIIPYKDDATLGEVMKAMAIVNLRALPGVPIRSYQMTESEKLECESGALDVITGTQIIDSQFRMIILEGLADKGMALLHEQLQRKAPNDPQGYRMFANDQLFFARRLYTLFEIDLKRIKLRYPLPLLMTTPDIYMRTKVSEQCHQALARLADMRHVQRLAEVKHLDLFPTAQMLLEVESKYGESITLEDIHGASGSSASGRTSVSAKSVREAANADAQALSVGKLKGSDDQLSSFSKRHTKTLKAPTDSTNVAFEQARRSRKETDFLLERKKRTKQVLADYSEKKKADALLDDPMHTPVYMYSGQKLRTQDALQEEMRKRLSKDRHATYTYSREFQSLALSMVNPEALRQTEEQEQRKKWTTERGFVYPAPRQPAEYYKHADAPSEARCEDLRQPFVDNANHPKPVSRDSGIGNDSSGPEFSTLPSKDMVFGGTNGDGTVNPEYFRSVHLCGEGLRLEMEEALKKEQDEWERRLVVDKRQLKFLAHGNICSLPREKPSQLDKISDILRGPVRSKPIRIVKNATLPSGKRVPLEKPPVTIHNQEEYVGCVAATFASTLRPTDSDQFLATNVTTGRPKDFFFPSKTSILTPQVKKFTTRKEIVPVRAMEKTGPVWTNE